MNSVLVLGADEFFGLTLCEKFLDEGFEVHAVLLPTKIKEKQILIEERLLWLGRNEHFHVEESEENQNHNRVFIIYSPELSEQIWKDRNDQAYLLTYHHDSGKVKQEANIQENVIAISLPKMYGPWNWNEEAERKQDCYFVNDVAEKLVEETNEWKRDQYLQEIEKKTSIEEAEKLMEEWRRQIPTKIDKM